MAQKASSENDQEKAQEYADKAEESFQKALSYASNADNSAGLYTEYANFLIRKSDFKHAFEYLQKVIESPDFDVCQELSEETSLNAWNLMVYDPPKSVSTDRL